MSVVPGTPFTLSQKRWHARNPGFIRFRDDTTRTWYIKTVKVFEVDGITYTRPGLFGELPGTAGVSVPQPMVQTKLDSWWLHDEEENAS